MDYVLETCDGYKIVYKDNGQKENEENSAENTSSVTVITPSLFAFDILLNVIFISS